MRKMFSILLIVILSLSKDKHCFAQNYADKEYYLIDSLDLDALTENDINLIESSLKKYHGAKRDTSKIIALNDICENMMHNDWHKYQYYHYNLIQKALQKKAPKNEEVTLKKLLAGSLNNIGFIFMTKGEIDSALFYNKKCLKIRLELDDKKGLAILYNNFGGIYKNQGKIALALKYFHKGLKMQEELNDFVGMGVSLNNIGQIYKIQKDLDLALDYYQKSLEIRLNNNDKLGMSGSYNNIAGVYRAKNDFEKALEYCLKGLKLSTEIGDKHGVASFYNNLGYIYKGLGDDKLNEEYWLKSIQLRLELGDKEGASSSYNNLAFLNYQNADYQKACEKSLKGLKLANDVGFPILIERNAGLLYLIYLKLGKYKDALEMRNIEITMRDSIASEENVKAAIEKQAKYEYEKQQAIDDKEHEKQLAIEQEAKEKQQVITYATAGGLGLVAIFLIFVFNRLQVTKRQKNTIEEQKLIVETAHYELEEKNQEILDSINYAKRIQNAILPPKKVVKEYLHESFILYKPKDIVAGDFYWLETIESNRLGVMSGENPTPNTQYSKQVLFAAADCTGHGVPGAMVSVICNNGLNRSVREHGLTDPGKILDKTREIVIQEFEKSEEEVKDGMDIALCSLTYKTQTTNNKTQPTAILQYAGANNPLWIIRKGAKDIEEIKADKQPIGKYAEPTPYTTHKIDLQKGDTIFIFSDGYADQFGGEKGKKFKASNFKKLLLSIQKENMERQREIINQAFEDWKGDLEQLDDVCVIGVKI